jgi:large subunit ribosomal protein L25
MEIVELKAQIRQRTGKKGAKECRRAGLLPGILYGLDDQALPVAVNPKELDRVLHTQAGANVIIQLNIADRAAQPLNVVVKDLQIDTIRDTLTSAAYRSMKPSKPPCRSGLWVKLPA